MKHFLYIIALIAFLASCKNDSYETGDGDLSYIHADYCDITVHGGRVVNIITDDGNLLPLSSEIGYSGSSTADTLLRRLIYYSMPTDRQTVRLMKMEPVSVVSPHALAEIEGPVKKDPVKFVSGWVSNNGKYINLHLGVMVGSNGGDNMQQMLMMLCDSIKATPEQIQHGKGNIYLSLYHDQAGYEQYYTQDLYLSLPFSTMVPKVEGTPVSNVQPDTVFVTVNTYDGKVTKQYVR